MKSKACARARSQLGAQDARQADTQRQRQLTDKAREAIALDLFARKRKPILILKPKAV